MPKVTQLVVGLRLETGQLEPGVYALLSQYPIFDYLHCLSVIIPILQVSKLILSLKAEGDGC